MANYRSMFAIAVPAVTALLGLLWFFGRKKQPARKPNAEPPDKSQLSKEKKVDVKPEQHQTILGGAKPDVSNGKAIGNPEVPPNLGGSHKSEKPAQEVLAKGDNSSLRSEGHSVALMTTTGGGDSAEIHIDPEVIQEEVVKPVFSQPSGSQRDNLKTDGQNVSDSLVESTCKLEEAVIVPSIVQEEHSSPLLSSPVKEQNREETSCQSEASSKDNVNGISKIKKIENTDSDKLANLDTESSDRVVVNNFDEQSDEDMAKPCVTSKVLIEEELKSDLRNKQSQDVQNTDLRSNIGSETKQLNSLTKENNNVIDLTNDESLIDLTDDAPTNFTDSQPQRQSENLKSEKMTEIAACQSSKVNSQSEAQEANSHSDSSSNCDNLSEASNDSGKGGSVHENTGLSMSEEDSIYEFNIPSDMCGLFIGTRGKSIKSISQQSGTKIRLQNNPYMRDFQICVIEGSRSAIDTACKIIKKRFPSIQLPGTELALPPHPVIMPEIMQLNLPEGVSLDVVVSSIVDAGRIFVQQPTHPTYPSLERLNTFMSQCYMQEGAVPDIPRPIEMGVICAAPMLNGWYRAQIMASHEETGECDIKYVDYGGYSRISSMLLKQIRSDFMTLPFEAVECYMANITPLENEQYFSAEAAVVLEELTQGKLLQGQVVGRAEDGTPYVHIYQMCGLNSVILVNREMVNRGVVRWIEGMD